ncbi:MAG: YIP1 family protein [Gemmobacter sp.]
MDFTRETLFAMLREAIADPRASARRIMAMDIDTGTRRLMLVLVAVLSVLVLYGGLGLIAALTGQAGGLAALPPPLAVAVLLGGVMAVMAVLAWAVGRQFGGTGSLADAILLVVWLHAVMIAVQIVQLIVLFLLPPFGSVVTLAALGLLFWMLTNFVAELHGFRSAGRVFAGVIGTFFAASLVLSILLSIFIGEPPQGL